MRGIKSARVAVCAAILLGFVIATGGSAGGSPPVFTVGAFPPDLGALRLHLGASDYVTFDAANSAGGYTAGTPEPIGVAGCALTVAPASLVLTPVPAGGSRQGRVGVVSDAIGVQVKGEGNGTPCGQVNGTTQSLVLSLGGPVAGRAMDYVEVDIEAKYGATVRADLFLDGGTTPVHSELLSTGGPDSGPDSADNDNFRWRLPSAAAGLIIFDTIRLSVDPTTPGGAFSLEGGADGTTPEPGGLAATALGGTTDSVFHIVDIDGVLGCGDSVTGGGGTAPQATITLVADGGCEAIPYALDTADEGGVQSILFQKDPSTAGVFRATFVWNVEASEYPVGPTSIDYGDGAGSHVMQWCDGTIADPIVPSGEQWCVTGQTSVLVDTGLMQVTEDVYGNGDPFNSR